MTYGKRTVHVSNGMVSEMRPFRPFAEVAAEFAVDFKVAHDKDLDHFLRDNGTIQEGKSMPNPNQKKAKPKKSGKGKGC